MRQQEERVMSRTVPRRLVGVLEQLGAMTRTGKEDRTSAEATTSARMGLGSWIIVIVLVGLLVAAGVFGYFGWAQGGGTDMPASGYVAMALGVILSLAVGFGLMALLFYSSRKGYDEPPVYIVSENEPENDSLESRTDPERR
jgi:hypothetical protein